MGWIRRRFRRLTTFCIATLCLRVIRIRYLFHGVEQLLTDLKLLEVYLLILQKSSKIEAKFLGMMKFAAPEMTIMDSVILIAAKDLARIRPAELPDVA